MNNKVTTFIDKTDTAIMIQRQNWGQFFISNLKKIRTALQLCNGTNSDIHIIKVTVERNESEINRTVERQEQVQKVNNFTAKQKRTEEEAAMRYYVWRAFHYGCKCINVVRDVIKNPSTNNLPIC